MAADAYTRYALESSLASAGLQASGETLPPDPSSPAGSARDANRSFPAGGSPAVVGANPLPAGRDKFAKEHVLRLLDTLQKPDRAQRQKAAQKLAQAMSQNVRVYRHKNGWILRHLDHDSGQPHSPNTDSERRSAT